MKVHLASFLIVATTGVAGCAPQAAPPSIAAAVAPARPQPLRGESLPTVRFVDVTEEAGLRFIHNNGAAGAKLLPETMGSGAAFLDYDGDGDQDLLLVNSDDWSHPGSKPRPTQAFYRNDGRGRFEDVTARVGLALTFFGMGAAVGDYDNDGDPDIYITALGGGHLFRNDVGMFREVTDEVRIGHVDGWLTGAAFFDMENDGDLDLFVCRYVDWSPETDRAQSTQLAGTGQGPAYDPPTAYNGSYCVLLRNDGGQFADVSEAAGIRVRTPDLKVPSAKALGVAPYDVDGDGLVDLAVSNDTVANFLFHNLGGGKFEEIGVTAGIAFDPSGATRAGMGIDWADFKNDGSLGLAIGNFANEMMALYVTDEPASLQFADLAALHGLGAPTQPPMKFGLVFFDYDLDGRLDLLSANGHLESDIARVQATETYEQSAQLFWNTGRMRRDRFVSVGPDAAGPDLFRPIVGRGAACADIDGDGDLDILLTANGGPARLFRNQGSGRNRWIRFHLKGRTSNRDAIGARLTVRAGGVEQRRQLFPARSYLCSGELPLTFGLGPADLAESATIAWPSGVTSELAGLKAGHRYEVDEPADRAARR
ncbi:MAG TPA: CRTAC1 family protein [Isosphaeraceae bacterium]|jgi:hypothetical protein|nr:CRTAC1 family protein [Isosphaeraceae bacterium]